MLALLVTLYFVALIATILRDPSNLNPAHADRRK
jgi:hypothetical protein